MSTTQPIREKEQVKKYIAYYDVIQPIPRNHALIMLGLHTALRISDLLALKWKDVYDFKLLRFRGHISVTEKKTGKQNVIALNSHARDSLEKYRKTRRLSPEDYIFTKNTDYSKPLSRSQAFRIVKKAANETLHEPHISCHSLRKTFGYHAWKQGTPPALLMDIYNHSSYRVTKKYLGISQDERDSIFLQLKL